MNQIFALNTSNITKFSIATRLLLVTKKLADIPDRTRAVPPAIATKDALEILLPKKLKVSREYNQSQTPHYAAKDHPETLLCENTPQALVAKPIVVTPQITAKAPLPKKPLNLFRTLNYYNPLIHAIRGIRKVAKQYNTPEGLSTP